MNEKIKKFMNLCEEITGFKKRRQDITGNLPTISFTYVGEYSTMTVYIYENGWDDSPFLGSDGVKTFLFHLQNPYEDDEYDEMINYLEDLKLKLNDKKV